MTAYQLRQHLAQAHNVTLRGLSGTHLAACHDSEHRLRPVDHDHPQGQGDR